MTERPQTPDGESGRPHAVAPNGASESRIGLRRRATVRPAASADEEPPRDTRWLTPDEAGVYAGVSTSLIYAWCKEGRLAHYRPGTAGKRGRILIDPADLDQLIREYRRERHQLLAYGEPSPPPP